jgi:general secretion pathway protein L
LDIGSYSIKAVEIVNTFKSYEIANFYENVIPNIEELEQDMLLPACMEQLFRQNRLKADRIITAMPGQYISSRIMTFGFADPRKIETAVVSEVADHVPFNLDDMIVDHQILGQMNGQTAALVVMTRKNFLESFLGHLKRIDIDPKLVDVDSLAFYNLASYLDVNPGDCIGLIDLGHEKTSVCIVQDGVLRMFRSINLGGRYLTEFLARDLETDFNSAQRVKHEFSRVFHEGDQGADLDQDSKMVAERLTLAANAIVKEIGRTLYAFKTYEKSPVTKLFISGGTSQIKGFEQYLEGQLEVQVRMNQLDRSALKINPNLASSMSIMPQSIAIGLRAVTSIKRHSQVNLRKGEFAYVQNYEAILKSAGAAFRFVGIALVILLITYAAQSFLYTGLIDAQQKEFLAEYQALFPKDKKASDKAVNFNKIRSEAVGKMRAQIEGRRQAVDSFLDENTNSPALTVLRDISSAIAKDVKVDVTQFQFIKSPQGGKLILKGETDSYPSVEKIVDALRNAPSLRDAKEKSSGPAPGTDNKVIQFVVEAALAGETTEEG